MKANELMIGDWVQTELPGKKGKYYARVLNLHSIIFDNGNYKILARIADSSVIVMGDEFEPIPLTPEILEKNGFVQTTGLEYAIGTTNDLEPLYYAQGKLLIDIGARCRSVCRICYVHQLQHVLRLCGIEKEIVL